MFEARTLAYVILSGLGGAGEGAGRMMRYSNLPLVAGKIKKWF